MKATGIVRRIDDLGRVEFRKKSEERFVYAREILWKYLLTEKENLI